MSSILITSCLYRCGTETGDCQNRFLPKSLGWRLEECLRKGGGHLEDIVFKKVTSFVVYFKIIFFYNFVNTVFELITVVLLSPASLLHSVY